MHANICNIKLCQIYYAEISTLIIFPFCSSLYVAIFLFSQRHPQNSSQRIRIIKAERKKCWFFFQLQNKPLKPTSDTIIESKSFWFPRGNVWLKFSKIKREDPDGSKIEFVLQWWAGKRKKNLGGKNIKWRSSGLEEDGCLVTSVGVWWNQEIH